MQRAFEKARRAAAARGSPSIIFIDEAEALLGQRRQGDNKADKHQMQQFLSEMDGIASGAGHSAVFVLAATNRPWDLDVAALRRLPKRFLVGLPSEAERVAYLARALRGSAAAAAQSSLSDEDIRRVAARTAGFSGSDLARLVEAAALWPLLAHNLQALKARRGQPPPNPMVVRSSPRCHVTAAGPPVAQAMDLSQLERVSVDHFHAACRVIRPVADDRALGDRLLAWGANNGALLLALPEPEPASAAVAAAEAEEEPSKADCE